MAQQQFEAAKAQLQEAEANNVKAQNDLVRYKQLVDKQEISQQQYDQAIASAKAEAAGVAGARASAQAAEAAGDPGSGQAGAGAGQLQQCQHGAETDADYAGQGCIGAGWAQQKKADLDQAQLNLQYTKIVAPVNGVVSNRTVEVGQNVAIGQELLKVINLDDVWITANYKGLPAARDEGWPASGYRRRCQRKNLSR